MMRIFKTLTLVALAFFVTGAGGDSVRKGAHRTEALVLGFALVAMNGSAASRTFTITNPKGGYAYANLEIARTRSAGTDFTMTCVSTVGTGVPVAQRTVCTYDSSGLCTSSTATQTSTTSVTENLAWVVGILGWTRTDCVVASAAANGSDLVTIIGNMVVQ